MLWGALAAGCGKKGPPLAPFSTEPSAPSSVTASRVGSTAAIQFTVPSTNADGRRPADLARVEVREFPQVPIRLERNFMRGALVGSVDVRPPPDPEARDAEDAEASADGDPGGDAESPVAAPGGTTSGIPEDELEPGAAQGQVIAVLDRDLTALPPDPDLVRPADPDLPEDEEDEPPLFLPAGPLLWPADLETRVYVVAGINRRGRQGRTAVVELSVLEVPLAPPALRLIYTNDDMMLSWEEAQVPPRRPIQGPRPAPASPAAPSPAPTATTSTSPSKPLSATSVVPFSVSGGYNVYEGTAGASPAARVWLGPATKPMNASLLSGLTFTTPREAFGTERCFFVRAVETYRGQTVQSDPSPTACVTPIDTFAPSAPDELSAVAGGGVISLLWAPSSSDDVEGYLVLRGEASGETLQALTPDPVPETTYRDASVQSGVTYVYVVLAVDGAGNRSAESNRAQETGR